MTDSMNGGSCEWWLRSTGCGKKGFSWLIGNGVGGGGTQEWRFVEIVMLLTLSSATKIFIMIN